MKRLNLERSGKPCRSPSTRPNWPGFAETCGEDAHCFAFALAHACFLFLGGVHMREVDGTVEDDFAAIRDAFAEAQLQDEGGAQLCVYRHGKRVVDLWTGHDKVNDRPYTADTISILMSCSKGVTATCAHMLVERGLLDPDAPVARYWPQFAANGKANIPVSYLLSHRAGLPSFPPESGIALNELLDWNRCVTALAEMKPLWTPGTAFT